MSEVQPSGMPATKSSMPDRNPHHPQAVNIDDLRFGLNLLTYWSGTPSAGVAIVVGQPYMNARGSMMVMVVIDGHDGPQFHEWYLADRGIVPHLGTHGGHWSVNYTLVA